MKKFFKFTTAAAALVALASCSNEDVFNQNPSFNGLSDKGTLTVNVEPLSDGVRTRALSNEDLTAINFEATDKIKVYDDELHRWDGYQFNKSSKKFELFTESDLTAPQFALYPFGQNDGGYEGMSESGNPAPVLEGGDPTGVIKTAWTKGGVTTATMRIPATYTYKESALTDGTNGYWCNLPMWGTVISTDGKLETDLKYMTAVLRVALKNVTSSKIDHLRIQAFKDESRTKQISLSGEFDAVLDTENPANTALKERLGGSEIIIDLGDADNADSYVFVPIVPCTNAIVVIKYEDATNTAVAGKDGKKEKVLSQKNYVRGTLYKAKGAEFDVTLGTPSAISKALMGAKAETEPVVINATQLTETTAEDNVITIPSGMTADITLNLTGIQTKVNKLYIEDENSSNPYAGNLTVVTAAATTGSEGIITQLKGAAVKFVGDYNKSEFDVYAKELVIGEAEKTSKATIATLGSMVEAITVAKDATVPAITAPAENALAEVLVEGTVTGAITANTNEKVATAVTVDGGTTGDIKTTGDVTITDGTVGAIGTSSVLASSITITASEGKTATSTTANTKGSFNVSGAGASVTGVSRVYGGKDATDVVINITDGASIKNLRTYATDVKEATPATITVSGLVGNIDAPASVVTINATTATTYTGTIDAARLNAYGKSVLTGNITSGKLVIRGAASVKDAIVSDNVSIKLDAEGEAVTGTLYVAQENVEGQGITISNGYVNAIDLKTKGAKKDVALKFGKAQVAVIDVVPNTDATLGKLVPSASAWDGKKIDKTKFAKYANVANVWTASQLATLGTPTGDVISLKNDINLGTETTWTMPTLAKHFYGENHTISGGKFVATDDNGTGLFKEISGERIVKDLTLTGATVKSEGKNQIGVLAGKAAAFQVKHITVNATLDVKGLANNVGGLVGSASGKATIIVDAGSKDVNTVTLSALAGQYYLGGLVGQCAGAEIKKTTVTITNGITFTPSQKLPTVEDATNSNAGTIGMYIGKSTDNVTIDAVNPAANDKIATKRSDLGFKLNFEKDASNTYYYFGGNYTEVGQFSEAGKTLTVGTGSSPVVATTTTTASERDIEGTGTDKSGKIDWATAKTKFGIFVASKAYAATDVK